MNRKSLADSICLDWLEVTDSFADQVKLGRCLYDAHPRAYPRQRTVEMYAEIQRLATEKLLWKYNIDELFYHAVYDFWVYGNTLSEDFYLRFINKTHEEKKSYVTYCNRLELTNLVNDRKSAKLLQDKYETYKFLGDQYYLREVVRIGGREDFGTFRDFVRRHRIFVYKPSSSSTGIGVRKIDISMYEDEESAFEAMLSYGRNIKEKCHNDASFLVEELIDQDERMAEIHPYSANGVRITTYRSGNAVELIYPWFKGGANKAFVTSAAFGTYDAGIDVKTGLVNTDGFKETGESDIAHPVTKMRFKGFRIPMWGEAVSLARELAGLMPNAINYVGWDLVLTPRGWCVMEGNFDGDFMWQMFLQAGYREEWENLTGIKMRDDFWWRN